MQTRIPERDEDHQCRRIPAQSLMTAPASPCVKPYGKFCRRPARSAGEITPPWAPIVRLPALDHAVIVMGRNVEMHEVYSSVCSFRGEGEDQGRIRITVVKFGRAPGLDHEPLRDDLEDRTGERAIEGLEWCTRLSADRDRRTSNR